MDTDKITLQTILQLGYAVYERRHAVPDHVRRAVWALLACRTALLGGHVQACPEGHVERIWYNSCRHRMCPPCAWVQVERWLAKQKARLLACEQYHVIFTIPHELNELWLANVPVMTQLLFASVHDTLVELLGDAQYLEATPGMIGGNAYSLSPRDFPLIGGSFCGLSQPAPGTGTPSAQGAYRHWRIAMPGLSNRSQWLSRTSLATDHRRASFATV